MRFNRTMYCAALVVSVIAGPSLGAETKADAINVAKPSATSLSNEPTPAGVRLQVLLDRAHFSPGKIDVRFGENAKKLLRAYEEAQRLPISDVVNADVWGKLAADGRPVTMN